MDPVAAARPLVEEAQRADERRLLVLAGDRDDGYDAVRSVLEGLAVPREGTTLVGPRDALGCEHVPQYRADALLGTTRDAVVLDAHDELRPNALGRVVGAVDGGGLLVLLTPPLDKWPDRRDTFDGAIAVPPFDVEAVTGHFRRRLVDTLYRHDGVAIWDVDAGAVVRDGLTDPDPPPSGGSPGVPEDAAFPRAVYAACLTAGQARAVRALEALGGDGDGVGDRATHRKDSPIPRAVVLEADRGRGKSAAVGLAAGALAVEGARIGVTAPAHRSAAEVFVRAAAIARELGADVETDGLDPPRRVDVARGGVVEFLDATAVAGRAADYDALVVDEAAALSVRLLESCLAADRVAFVTTVHGYEGAGRGFDVRFRERLDDADHEVFDVTIETPIRYATGDPVERWAFHALLLDARPPVEPLVAEATPDSVEYVALESADLLADEHLLREAFGLLVLAHYRTEPSDLARLLDAPNLSVRALLHDGHVAAVALLAREGDLDADTRTDAYDGGRIAGNMIPDVLTSQARDEAAGEPVGYRVMRIATHHAVRSRGLGSRLLAGIREEVSDDVDWLGVGYGATPELLSFWTANGYRTVYCSTTRNDASGEYSAVMLDPTSAAGADLADRHGRWFARRVGSMLADPLRDQDPDVARALLASVDAELAPDLPLDDRDWRVVAGMAYGPGLYDTVPRPFRRLAVRYLLDCGFESAAGRGRLASGEVDKATEAESPGGKGAAEPLLSPRQERLLVRKVCQGHPWTAVADELSYHSRGETMRGLGEAYQPLVDAYGTPAALAERDRYLD